MALIISLTIIGILLIIAEIVLIPGIFVAGTLGLLAMAGSCCILLAVTSTVLTLRSKTWKKLSLHTEIDSRTDSAPEDKGIAVGSEGKTITRLAPMGKVLFGDITVECTARNGLIDPGQEVTVILIDDNKIYVKPK